MFCNVEERSVIEEKDLEFSVYELPMALHAEGLDSIVLSKLSLQDDQCDIFAWENIIERLRHPRYGVTIGLVGKYSDLRDAYKSVNEALVHAGIANGCAVDVVAIDSEDIERSGISCLEKVDGILVPGGFGNRGIEGKILAAKFARENDVPYFGICLGMQVAVIEFARNVAKIPNASSEEFCPDGDANVVCMIASQKTVDDKGGTMRLGSYNCELLEDSLSWMAYGRTPISERHRHRYEFNPKFEEILKRKGLTIAGKTQDIGLIEIVENPSLSWFVAVQFHPEFSSKPTRPHPLFVDFIKAAGGRKNVNSLEKA
jgi:CTP synthase